MENQQNTLVADLVNANLNVIEEKVLVKLPTDIYKLAKAASDAIGETAVVLGDGIEPNGPQVEAIWRGFVNQHVIDYAVLRGQVEADKIKSEILKNVTKLLLNPTSTTLRALTDEVKDNGSQLESLWRAFLTEGTNLKQLLESTLKPALQLIPSLGSNDGFVDLIVGLVETELKKVIGKE